MKINWKAKLTSRKFWAAIIGVAMSIMTLFHVDSLTQTHVEALGWGIAALIAYILGEGLVDAKAAATITDSTEKEE